MLCLVSLLCLGDEQVISLFSIHVDTLVNLGGELVLRVFFLFCRGGGGGAVKVLSSFPVFFLAINYPWSKIFFRVGISEEKSENRNEAIFFFWKKLEWTAVW